jgi:hypothetical protein
MSETTVVLYEPKALPQVEDMKRFKLLLGVLHIYQKRGESFGLLAVDDSGGFRLVFDGTGDRPFIIEQKAPAGHWFTWLDFCTLEIATNTFYRVSQ